MSQDDYPQMWVLIELDKISKILGGGTPSRSNPGYFNGDILWATPTDVTALDNLWIEETKERITKFGLKNSSAILLPPRAVLMTSRATIGKTAIARYPIATNQGFANFICNEELLDSEYLAYWLTSIKTRLLNIAGGTTFKEITRTALKKIKIPLPLLLEQQEIASFLREADALRRLRQQANNKSQKLPLSIFYEMFQSPASWQKTVSLEQLVKFVGGGTPSRKVKRYFTGEIPWATSKDMKFRYLNDAQEHITEEAIKNSATNLVPPGTILIVVKSKILLHSLPIGITTRSFCFGQDIKGLICNPVVEPRFIAAALSAQARHILNQARGVNTEGLTLEILRKVQIPDVTPSEQEEFVKRVIEYDHIEQGSLASTDKLNVLFQSILERAFTGELTAAWREQHQEELARAAAERDRLLQISQPETEEQAEEGTIAPQQSELHRDRAELLNNLSDTQRKTYELVIQETAYFTPEGLGLKHNLSRNQLQGSLQLLAATGLIVPLTLPTKTTKGLRYELAYRNLNPDDDTRLSDEILGSDQELEKERV